MLVRHSSPRERTILRRPLTIRVGVIEELAEHIASALVKRLVTLEVAHHRVDQLVLKRFRSCLIKQARVVLHELSLQARFALDKLVGQADKLNQEPIRSLLGNLIVDEGQEEGVQ